jgi:2-C-methyl-D-erythritol 4-phosphate cytidylyltransferase
MNSEIPKQFLKINGEAVIRHTVRNFKNWGLFKKIVVVAPLDYIEQTESELSDLLEYNDRIIEGGQTRHESTLKGLSANSYENDIIVVHDGARPFITPKEIDEITNSVLEFGASSLSEKVSETLVSSLNDKVNTIINRDNAFTIKTPQAFHSSLLKSLLEVKQVSEITDLCTWLIQIGVKVSLKESNPYNIKITTKEDLSKAEYYFSLFSKQEQL